MTLEGVPIGKAIQIVTFAFLGELLKTRGVLGSLIDSLCSPEVCINGTASQLSTGVVLDESPMGTLLTPGSYSRFQDVSSRALANPGFSVNQQAGLIVAQLSPMIAYPRPVYQDQPQLIGEDFGKPNTPVASFLLAEGYHAAFGIGGAVKVLAHDSCPDTKQWSLKGLELMSVSPAIVQAGVALAEVAALVRLHVSARRAIPVHAVIHVPKGSLDPTVSPAPTVISRQEIIVTMGQLARGPASPSI